MATRQPYAYFGIAPSRIGSVDEEGNFYWKEWVDPDRQEDWYGFSDVWQPGMHSTAGYWAEIDRNPSGYYTDNSSTFDNFIERAVLGGLAVIGGVAATGGASGATGFETLGAESLGRSAPPSEWSSWVGREWQPTVGKSIYDELQKRYPKTMSFDLETFGSNLWSEVQEETGQWLDDQVSGGGGPVIPDYGPIDGGTEVMTPTMGVFPAAGAAAMALGSRLARMFGGRGATFVINGVRGRLDQLWPYVRRYGPTAVATALGVGVAELATLLAQAPTQGRRRRGRGISAANIRTAKRVIRFNKQLSRQLGTGGGGRRYSYPFPHYHRRRR